MPRYLLLFIVLLALFVASRASATDRPSGAAGVHAGGLSCFSIRPPDAPTKPETKSSPALNQSCDELCAAKGAACTATTGTRNPPYACDAQDYDPDSTLCRCCAIS